MEHSNEELEVVKVDEEIEKAATTTPRDSKQTESNTFDR